MVPALQSSASSQQHQNTFRLMYFRTNTNRLAIKETSWRITHIPGHPYCPRAISYLLICLLYCAPGSEAAPEIDLMSAPRLMVNGTCHHSQPRVFATRRQSDF